MKILKFTISSRISCHLRRKHYDVLHRSISQSHISSVVSESCIGHNYCRLKLSKYLTNVAVASLGGGRGGERTAPNETIFLWSNLHRIVSRQTRSDR